MLVSISIRIISTFFCGRWTVEASPFPWLPWNQRVWPWVNLTIVSRARRFGVWRNLIYCTHQDTITLLVQFENIDNTAAHAVFTSSWSAASKAEVHSQQRFHFMASNAEIRVDQAHRGWLKSTRGIYFGRYEVTTDAEGYTSCNPLYMNYSSRDGKFGGQLGYGYRSIEYFIDGTRHHNLHGVLNDSTLLASIQSTVGVTAILEAGRRSLLSGKRVRLEWNGEDCCLVVESWIESFCAIMSRFQCLNYF